MRSREDIFMYSMPKRPSTARMWWNVQLLLPGGERIITQWLTGLCFVRLGYTYRSMRVGKVNMATEMSESMLLSDMLSEVLPDMLIGCSGVLGI